MSAALAASFERPRPGAGATNMVFRSGPLFISSKGLGWKSWKKRWFILTRTSLVFFKNDPSAIPQKKGEINLTLGGIDLNNSGSVVVREDKKLLTVLFPDGRDGRAFTLKAETSEDLYKWKSALENALAQAPSAALVMGHNGIFRSDTSDAIEGSFHQWRDKWPVKSLVVGRPILLALEDIDGGPSFLEKALRFLEKFGTKVEGILRQSADVEIVERRVHEYEQGKTEFESDEDAHVVGDCVKHVLRELPSSPVPAACCLALLDAYKIGRKEARINAMRSAILDTFPEPNCRLLQRILKMMRSISSHAHENRMTVSALATCMAPLLLRPLLAGECELEDDYEVYSDDSAHLLAAANAANNAQVIVTTLLEEYENIFADENQQRCSISADSQIAISGSEDSTDDENLVMKDNGYHDAENEVDHDADDDPGHVLSGKLSESSDFADSDSYDYKVLEGNDSDVGSPKDKDRAANTSFLVDPVWTRDSNVQLLEQQGRTNKKSGSLINETDITIVLPGGESCQSMGEILASMDPGNPKPVYGLESSTEKPMEKVTVSNLNPKWSIFWGRNSATKMPLMESVYSSREEELAIQRLEIAKNDLSQRIAKEARGNAILQASLERRKHALHERRLALEQDVSRLQEQLQAERDVSAALEDGLDMPSAQFSSSHSVNSKTRAELEEIALAEADVARLKQKVAELHHQLNQQRQHHSGSPSDSSDQYHVQNHTSHQRLLRQDFDETLAFVNHEREQRSEECLLGADWRNVNRQGVPTGGSNRQSSWKQFSDSTGVVDHKFSETSTNMPVDEFYDVDSASVPSASRAIEVLDYPRQPLAMTSDLVELTIRLDFFKERRSQLMEQLHNLDLNYGAASQDFMYRPSPPAWN